MSVFFTSDLHLGHYNATEMRPRFRGESVDYHDFTLIENINSKVHKRDKLFILGDLAFTDSGMKWASQIQCRNVELIMGNHDRYPIRKYVGLGWRVHGFRGYNNFWLSHCPIHPQEFYRKRGNIHGHIHACSQQQLSDPRYFNVNIDLNGYYPVPFQKIVSHFDLNESII